MNDLRIATVRAIHDALALRGLTGDGGFIRTAAPEAYMTAARLRLAREVLGHLPADADDRDVDELVEQVGPIVSRYVARTTP